MRVEILANGNQRRHWSQDDRTRILAEASSAAKQAQYDLAGFEVVPNQIEAIATRSPP